MTLIDHYSVLLQESIDGLVLNSGGFYIDGTFGRGGHSREILNRLDRSGRLIAFDKDPEAIAVGQKLEAEDKRFTVIHGSFLRMKSAVALLGGGQADGVLLDLGVSSPQLDDPERGFSFLKDGPLDMRMNNSAGPAAAEWLATAEENEIAGVLKGYGEEKFAKKIARAIVKTRDEKPITRTSELADIVSAANPKWEKNKHPATRAFQAIRIFINNELEDLEKALAESLGVLKGGGRLVVVSFHSLEDRMVKRFFRDKSRGKDFPISVPLTDEMLNKELKTIGKPIKADVDEVRENTRSRSAIMRIAERL